MYLISLFVKVIPELSPVLYSLLNSAISENLYQTSSYVCPFLATLDKIFPKIGLWWRTLLDCIILGNWVLENFVLAEEQFAKKLKILGTGVSLNCNRCGELISSLEFPIQFDERFKVIYVPLFIRDFNLLSCELDNLTFKVLNWVNLY